MSEEVKVESKHKLNKKFLLFAIIGIVIVTIIAIVSIVPTSVRAKEVKEQLSLGDKYLSELNYEQAEATYLAILKIDPKCEDAYIGLANVYIATEQYEQAEEILRKAEEQLGETKVIKEKREELERKRKGQEEKLKPTVTNTPIPTVTDTPKPNQETAEEYFEYTIQNEEVIITGITDNSLIEIIIPEKIQGYLVTSIDDNAFMFCDNLVSVSIPNSVISIGSGTFQHCSNLLSIGIPSSVTSIGTATFVFCDNLMEILVDENNEWYSSLDGVLYDKQKKSILCLPAGKNIENYIIPNEVESIGDTAFTSCSKLLSISIPNSVMSIGDDAFGWCSSLKEILVDESNERYSLLDGALYDKQKKSILCMPIGKNIKNYVIPNGIETIGNLAFSDCSNLLSISIPSSLINIGYMSFDGCSNLSSIIIPNSVKSIGYSAFANCSSLSSITIPDSITNIEYNTFFGCSSLNSIIISNSVISIEDDAFLNCDNVIIYTPKGSYAEAYAIENNIPYQNE